MPSDTHTNKLPDSTRSFIADEGRATPIPNRYLELAHQTGIDAGVESIESCRLILIVESALRALHLLFAAVLHEPTEWELDAFFEDFIRRCLMNPDALETR